MKITLTPQESEQMFFDSMCNVFGTGYFDGYGLELDYNEKDYKESKEKLQNPCFEDVLLQMLKDGKTLTLVDIECDGEYTRSITLEDVHNKVCNTPTNHLMDMINEDGDVVTSDVILQTVFFDEIIFG
jgi:hypothetical protein